MKYHIAHCNAAPNRLLLLSAAKPSKNHSINTFTGTGFPCLIQSKNITEYPGIKISDVGLWWINTILGIKTYLCLESAAYRVRVEEGFGVRTNFNSAIPCVPTELHSRL